MPELINVREADVCEANKSLLERYAPTQLVNADGYIEVNRINNIEQRKDFLEQFYENETSNTQYIKGSYQKQKYKSKHTIKLLIATLALIGAGYLLVPLFITSSIILPIIPVLLAGIAIIALTEFYFNRRLNTLESNKLQAEAFLDKIMVNKGSNEKEANINRAVNDSTQEIKETIQQATREVTKILSEKVDTFSENTQRFFSTFPTTSHENPDVFHENEKTLSPSHT